MCVRVVPASLLIDAVNTKASVMNAVQRGLTSKQKEVVKMKTAIDVAMECAFYLCGLSTKCPYTYTECDLKSCRRVQIAQMAINMVLKDEYH